MMQGFATGEDPILTDRFQWEQHLIRVAHLSELPILGLDLCKQLLGRRDLPDASLGALLAA